VSSVATTVVNEKDGWLRLSASGFTFSAPTIQVKLTQAPAVVAPQEKVTTPKVSKKIVCIKGKTTKTFTTKKCPSGWKKK
jgi:hypothetical protein